METTKKSPRKASTTAPLDERILSSYKEQLLLHGKRPVSVFKFCLDLGIKEEDFYNFFGSFDGVEKHIWAGFIEKTIQRLKEDDSYINFSAREKVLAFYFTLLEELKANRSLVLFQLSGNNRFDYAPPFLKDFKSAFTQLITGILDEGRGNGEIAMRPLLDMRYPQLFWLHMGFVLNFWKQDNSPGFEKTDAAVEKSVNLAFDLISKGAVDSVIDFGKFLYQQKL